MKYWKSGLAEISVYAGREDRYGSLRDEVSTLVFVYEELDDKTRIKVESDKIPVERHVPVLKLNRLQHFNTGIYDYSVMTSVFTGLGGPGVETLFSPRKISLTVQEWCGMVFQETIPRGKNLNLTWHSYFESEGEGQRKISIPSHALYEDALPIWVRELDGTWMQPGDSQSVEIFPREWRTRKLHRPAAFEKAVITKSGPMTYTSGKQTWPAVSFTVLAPWDTTTFYVEDRAPRHLLAWHLSTGGYGEWQKSVRKSYWMRNKPENDGLRDELGLPHQPNPPPKGHAQKP